MTAAALSNALKSLLSRAGVENPDGDMLCILEATLGYSRVDLMTRGDREIDDSTCEKAIDLARRRASGEPIQYVVGSWSFMGRDYLVGEGVLIPRDDTEVVTQAALRLLTPLPRPTVVDLCAGSGIIAVTVKKERPDATVSAVEKSDIAFDYLSRNCEKNQADIHLIHADLIDCAEKFADRSLDMIISNPPYIRTEELPTLQSEVQYEPKMALDGGEDGYLFYEAIIRLYTKKLKEGGFIAFEIGEGQYDYIARLLMQNGYADIRGYLDIQNITRAITARKAESK